MNFAFADKTGKTWDLSLTIGAAARVKRLCSIDLLKLDEPVSPTNRLPLLTAIGLDLELLATVLYAICETQAAADNITPEAFADRLDGKAVDAGIRALWESLADFIQPRRPDLAAGIRKQAQLIEQEANRVAGEVAHLSIPGSTSGSSPESSASILEGSPSES